MNKKAILYGISYNFLMFLVFIQVGFALAIGIFIYKNAPNLNITLPAYVIIIGIIAAPLNQYFLL